MPRAYSRHTINRLAIFFSSVVIFCFPLAASGAVAINKADNGANLTDPSSWVGGAVPGSFDSAVWGPTLSGSNSIATGGSLALGQLAVLNPGGPVTIGGSGALTLNGIGGVGIDMSAATQDLTINCPVQLAGGQIWNVSAGRTLTVSGTISGTFGLTIAGNGTTVLGSPIRYTGGTTVAGGTLKMTPASIENWSLAVMPGATLDLNGQSLSFYPQIGNTLSVAGSGAGGLGAIVSSTNGGTVGLNMQLAADTTIGGNYPWTMRAQIACNGYSLTKTGSNIISFVQASTAGVKNVYINAGAIDLYNNAFLGSLRSGSIFVNSGGTLGIDVNTSVGSYQSPTVLAGGPLVLGMTAGTLDAIVEAGISLNAPGLFVPQHNSILRLSGTITDGTSSNGIVLAGDADSQLILNGNNTFTGSTLVSAGTLGLGNTLALKNSVLDTSGSGTLSFGTLSAATIGGLAGAGSLALLTANTRALAFSVGNNNANSTYSGAMQGVGSLIKIGSGTLLLTGNNTYSGTTAVNQGKLAVNGSLISPVTVNSGGTLGGTGSLTGVTLNTGGHLAPGNSPGTLILSGSLSLLAGSVLDYELGTPATSDLISMPAGTLLLSSQQFADFHFTPLPGFNDGTYTLIDASSINGGLGSNLTGTINGHVASLAIQGNDLVLNVVPEPGTIALLAAGIVAIVLDARRRRRL
jgi:autotransporter-associated beta strand protein